MTENNHLDWIKDNAEHFENAQSEAERRAILKTRREVHRLMENGDNSDDKKNDHSNFVDRTLKKNRRDSEERSL